MSDDDARNQNDGLGPCPVCGRPMTAGASGEHHHWVPRSHGGRAVSPVHAVCHRMIHRVFTDAELAETYSSAEAIRAHPEIGKFIHWVRKRPPEYADWPERLGRWGRSRGRKS